MNNSLDCSTANYLPSSLSTSRDGIINDIFTYLSQNGEGNNIISLIEQLYNNKTSKISYKYFVDSTTQNIDNVNNGNIQKDTVHNFINKIASNQLSNYKIIVVSVGDMNDKLDINLNTYNNNTIVSYVALCNIIDMMYYIHIVYLYFGILSKIFNDIDTIIDCHLLYGLILFCSICELIILDVSLQMWLGIFGCLYIRNIYVKLEDAL